MSPTARRWPEPRKIALLTALYLVQGLPFGFQSNALALYLTELNLTMTQVSLSRALALPWLLKALWAPLVDRFGSERFGRRKSWIVPLQVLLAVTCFVAAFFPLTRERLPPFLLLLLMMNFFAATQDIAVDGLAVDLLSAHELGAGNAAQVVGYKIGILVGGSLLVALAAKLGWASLFLSMGGLCLLVVTAVFFVNEPRTHVEGVARERLAWPELVKRLKGIVTSPGAGWLLLAVATYKMGETLADAMFGAFLVRVHHIPKEQVALWIGAWGMIFSVAGSLMGGLLATRVPLVRAVAITGALRVIPLVAQWLVVGGAWASTAEVIIPVTCAEHFFGGLLTTTMFALMMASVDRRIGATHYTLLATVEVAGKSVPGLLSGVLVDAFSFVPVFGASVVLSLGFLTVLPFVPRPPPPQPAAS